jgi:hypothetical protein
MTPKLNQIAALPLLVLVLACTACSTTQKQEQQLAANPVAQDDQPALTDEQQDEGIICKREPVTGTRISKKVCTTAAQRERAQQMGQENLLNTQRRSTTPTISE